MNKNNRMNYSIAAVLLLSFLILTWMVGTYDVRPIGPEGSSVGLSEANQRIFTFFGVNLFWYNLTDWLGLVALVPAGAFALLGLCQFIKRKSLRRVDRDILLLGMFYLLLIFCYALFEKIIVNYRPILIGGKLEASYPSSHTMIVVSIMITTMMQAHSRIKNGPVLRGIDSFSVLIVLVTPAGRLISGAHWFTDIAGGLILSSALIMLYHSVNTRVRSNEKSCLLPWMTS